MTFPDLKFKYPWRPYQARVLKAVHHHLDDQRLHVVAAPGAGKTTLGLEVFRLLRKKTLVLSPTRVIRDQWISRLSDFTDMPTSQLAWVSNNIDKPKTLTSITYQALHSRMKPELNQETAAELFDDEEPLDIDEVDNFIETIKAQSIQVIIMDEAHHLRAEWWKAIERVFSSIPELVLVSLTATPPYDAQGHEWIRYEKLCGPIDEEISVPELVKSKTLCPHQDFIWTVDITTSEKQLVKDHESRVQNLCQSLITNPEFKTIIYNHPWLQNNADEQSIIKHPKVAMALLVFCKATSKPIQKTLLSILDLTNRDIPELTRQWWQIIIESALFSNTFEHDRNQQDFIEKLKKQLRATELLHKKELSVAFSKKILRTLSQSPSKVKGCLQIHKLELKKRQNNLRQVILTDYIRDEGLVGETKIGRVTLGAWPIYQGLVLDSPIRDKIGLLTGRLCLISYELVGKLKEHLQVEKCQFEDFDHLGRVSVVTGPLNQLTHAFTELLMQGDLKVLVGTRSLLGEGWDAPAINSLILASAVGSFMLTNQMRGRAIRLDKNRPDKISSIWHLVAIDTQSPCGLSDYYDLKKRFETFVGLSEKKPTIESGFARLNTTGLNNLVQINSARYAERNNNWQMIWRFRNRKKIASRWQDALTIDENARVLPSVKAPNTNKIQFYHFKNSFHKLWWQLVLVIGILLETVAFGLISDQSIYWTLTLGIIALVSFKLPTTIKAVKGLIWHSPVDGSLKQIGKALCAALCQTGQIQTSFRRLKVNSVRADDGSFYLGLIGATFYESSLFADCLNEILSPIDNPRYIIIRESGFLGFQKDDYHAVPMKLATKKELAQTFYLAWCKYVCPTELIYTRSPQGRQHLIKAKMRAFSSLFSEEVKRQDRWQ
ncbi:DEAD/DEAH box helicase [Aliikangiella marina]|uniref:DEAD/DEAH box helicase n=1 Tax=Aliikangiella marina TaxID=1712262 RepID=A0A545T4E2_9GAMM|nr:DEAD/DEAH box helicase family protein [Aliikangiella marina]TQV72091.1 DEAD/DEAH box helicase [Aliikangiella marina]